MHDRIVTLSQHTHLLCTKEDIIHVPGETYKKTKLPIHLPLNIIFHKETLSLRYISEKYMAMELEREREREIVGGPTPSERRKSKRELEQMMGRKHGNGRIPFANALADVLYR